MGMQKLADGVYVYTDSDGGTDPATVSSLVVVTDDGVLVGDGLGRVGDVAESDAMVRRLFAEIAKLTDQPVRYLVNCSWHPDHTNGNHLFRDAGAVIIAHRRARADLLAFYETTPDVPRAPPTVVFDDTLTLFLGGREIRVQHLGRAHTAADAVIYLPRERVAFLSEIFFNKQFPGLRSGYPTEWVRTLDRALALDADIFVPGHGLVENGGRLRSTVERMRDDLIDMRREIEGYHRQGLTRAQIMERKPLQKYASQINAYRNLPIAVDRILAELTAGAGGLR
jgi:glyoxylase-like metal-dependent hydrolase (beta-lactamase superfamily II)